MGGYIYIHSPNHPNHNCNLRVAEHILVWEEANNRYLPKGWIVHHINGIRDDNRIENLFAMPKRNHTSHLLLQETRKRLLALENELRRIKAQRHFTL